MSRSAPILLAAALFALAFQTAPAAALNDRSFVSGLGDDGNACTRAAPCKTFQGAHDKTAAKGVINCVDPAEYGMVVIKKSISIDCDAARGSINALWEGISIDTLPEDIVSISGLDIAGPRTSRAGIRLQSGFRSVLHVRNVTVSGVASGIEFKPRNLSQLFVTDSAFRNNNMGIWMLVGVNDYDPEAGLNAHFSRVLVENNSNSGVWAGSEVGRGINLSMQDCVISGNGERGVIALGPQAPYNSGRVSVSITRTMVSGNFGYGLYASPSATIHVGSSMISANASAFNTSYRGPILSYGNNQVNSNGGGEAFTGMVGQK